MALRAFLSTWSVSAYDADGFRRVSNPILDHIGDNDLDAECSMYYPDADADGLPDKNRVLVFIASDTLTSTQIENAKNLTGVSLIPPFPLSTVLSNIPLATRQNMLSIISNNNIPTDGITLASTYQEALEIIITHFIPTFPGLKNIKDEFG